MSAAELPRAIHPSDLGPAEYSAIAASLAEIAGVRSITLYGSRARGDHRYNSDVDLLLEGDELGYEARAEAFRRVRALRISHKVDVLIDRWISEPRLLENIRREGIPLWPR